MQVPPPVEVPPVPHMTAAMDEEAGDGIIISIRGPEITASRHMSTSQDVPQSQEWMTAEPQEWTLTNATRQSQEWIVPQSQEWTTAEPQEWTLTNAQMRQTVEQVLPEKPQLQMTAAPQEWAPKWQMTNA
jgi:hypothetical protein